MSSYTADAEAALAYAPPAGFPVLVLGVTEGQALDVPDPVDTVEVTWTLLDLPGVFTERVVKLGNWPRDVGYLLQFRILQIYEIYNLLPGGPPLPVFPELPPPVGAE